MIGKVLRETTARGGGQPEADAESAHPSLNFPNGGIIPMPTGDRKQTMTNVCVIFDLDGTLVDSEFQSNQAFLDLLPEIDEPVTALINRYRGIRLAPVLADLEGRLGRKSPRC